MAKKVLNNARWFSCLSEPLKEDLAKIMRPIDAAEGQILCEEGKTLNDFIIIEKGGIIRSKKLGEGTDGSSIVIDEMGPGYVTGFLHVAGVENENAYATMTAKAHTKVWLVSGDEFRDMLLANPQHAMDLISFLTMDMRKGTKYVRAILSKNAGDESKGESGSEKTSLKVLCYDTTSWVKENFEPQIEEFNKSNPCLEITMDYTQDRLSVKSAKYAAGYDAVCLFVNDVADSDVLHILSMCGVKMIAMRCAGFDRVDTKAARTFGISVARVPAYSPYAVAEHAIALLMTVNRKTNTASTRVKMANFTLDSGLLGFDINGKTVGVMGTGKIGQILCKIVTGFGVNLLTYDVFESDEVKALGGKYVSKEEIYKQSDIIFLMMPLLPATKHTINSEVLPLLKRGVILINTSRGGLIDTSALLEGLKSGIIGGCGIDVYENEGDYFFQDWSARNIEDPVLVALMGNNKVVMTAHQAFFTREAIEKIVETTIQNFDNYSSGLRGKDLPNSVS